MVEKSVLARRGFLLAFYSQDINKVLLTFEAFGLKEQLNWEFSRFFILFSCYNNRNSKILEQDFSFYFKIKTIREKIVSSKIFM